MRPTYGFGSMACCIVTGKGGVCLTPSWMPWPATAFGASILSAEPLRAGKTYPSAIRYKPRLLTTVFHRSHEHILAYTRGGQQPWHIRWAYRALGEPVVLEADIIDALQAFLICGREARLLAHLNQDGAKAFYAISSEAATLIPGGVCLKCDETDRIIIRPASEAEFWKNAPSMEYYATKGRYVIREFDARQKYYQDRYNKGALRRVVAEEHTGTAGH